MFLPFAGIDQNHVAANNSCGENAKSILSGSNSHQNYDPFSRGSGITISLYFLPGGRENPNLHIHKSPSAFISKYPIIVEESIIHLAEDPSTLKPLCLGIVFLKMIHDQVKHDRALA